MEVGLLALAKLLGAVLIFFGMIAVELDKRTQEPECNSNNIECSEELQER